MAAKDFARLHNQDRAHLASVRGDDRFINPALKGRALDLSDAIQPIWQIKPALKSRYLVKNWIDRGALSVVYGESNVGKTFFALDLAMHVAARLPWHGHKVADVDTDGNWPGPVLYIAGEGGHGIRNRIEAVRRERSDIMERIEGESDFCLLPTGLDLCGPNDVEALSEAIAEWADFVALIVVDTLARAMGDGDENTAKDMGAFVRNVDQLREETGAHVMVIHHSGKDTSKGARGSNSLRAAADTEIELTRSGAVVMAETKKQRDMPTDQVFAYTLKGVFLGTDEDGDDVTSAIVQPTEPVKKTPRLSGQQKIAMQALDDALAKDGEKKPGDMFPDNRRCVSLESWREYCDRHSLSSGEGESSRRTAFHKVKNALQNKEIIRVVDGFVWRCSE